MFCSWFVTNIVSVTGFLAVTSVMFRTSNHFGAVSGLSSTGVSSTLGSVVWTGLFVTVGFIPKIGNLTVGIKMVGSF